MDLYDRTMNLNEHTTINYHRLPPHHLTADLDPPSPSTTTIYLVFVSRISLYVFSANDPHHHHYQAWNTSFYSLLCSKKNKISDFLINEATVMKHSSNENSNNTQASDLTANIDLSVLQERLTNMINLG
ncbi:Uncharacterized protein Fot_36201 [Forsythia ovata]|uniref:Uncharacterized protein n=1 Tax=Forsythia ovata TaxID=205694 RepID=A0ABD1SNR7_9LAMI